MTILDSAGSTSARGVERRRLSLSSVVLALPAVALLAAWLGWPIVDGGYFPRDWYPVGLGLVGVLAVVVAGNPAMPNRRAARVALGLFAALVAWNLLSIAWAEAPGRAWEAADKLLLYLTVAFIAALLRWTPAGAAAVLGAWAVGIGVACLVPLVDSLISSDLTEFFAAKRLDQPLGYAGASAALAAIGVWPALALSSRRGTPWPIQGAFLGLSVFLVGYSLLFQSRGSVLGLVAMIPVFVLLAPDRGRVAVRLVIAAGGLALALGPVLDVYSVAVDDGDVAGALDGAAAALGLGTGLAALAGALAALAERRVLRTARASRVLRRAAVTAVGALAVAAVALAAANAGNIANRVGDRWQAFETGRSESHALRIASTDDPQRYDYFRVALDAWRDDPVVGTGAGGFETVYAAQRREEKHSRYVHDIWLRFLSETGAIGALLFVALVVVVVSGLVSMRRREREPRVASIVAASIAVLGTFLVHASLDWIDEFPAIAAPALALPFLAFGVAAPPPRSGTRVRSQTAGAAAVLAVAAMLALAGASLAVPYLALRYTERAALRWRAEPREAFDDLARAAAINTLSSQPLLLEGTIATELGRDRRARRAYERALARERSWYPYFELAMLDAHAGRIRSARGRIGVASRLNTRDPILAEVRRRILHGDPVDPRAVHREIREAIQRRFYALQPNP